MTGGTNVEKLFQALDGHSFWGYKLFAIPMYLFLLLAFTVITANQLDIIPSSMVGSIGAMFIIGIAMDSLQDSPRRLKYTSNDPPSSARSVPPPI